MVNYRKIYEQYYGVEIPKGYHVHHKDFNHRNDDPLNLEALPPDEHAKLHGFLNNFVMSQARACELARARSRIVHKGNQYAKGMKHTQEWKLEHSIWMMGNNLARGAKHSQEVCDAKAARAIGNKHALGFKHTEEYKSKKATQMVGNQYAAGRSYSPEQIVCPYCQRSGGNNVMKRWHFDKCRKSPKT